MLCLQQLSSIVYPVTGLSSFPSIYICISKAADPLPKLTKLSSPSLLLHDNTSNNGDNTSYSYCATLDTMQQLKLKLYNTQQQSKSI